MKKALALTCLMALGLGTGCGDDDAGPCAGITCSGHGQCQEMNGQPECVCDSGYEPDGLQCIDPSAQVQTTNQILQYGVVWTFDSEVPYGRFANGDYWVVGPVTVTRLTPTWNGQHNGWEVNPESTVDQGFDHRIHNFVPERVPDLPYLARPGESLVKSISVPASETDCRPCLQTAAVLTVLEEVPPDSGETVFRPPYFGTDKPFYFTTDLQTGLLPTVDATQDVPSLSDVAGWFQRVQMDHKVNWTGRSMHPADNMPDYGSSIASRNANGALRLMLSDSVADKMEALIHYVQCGLDILYMAQGGVTWPAGGGHAEGRKLPATLAAVLLDDANLQAFVSGAATEVFGENGGMYYSSVADTVLFGQTWNSEDNYWTNLVFDTGSRTIPDPYGWIDGGHRPGGSYQFCCTSLCWKSTATALYLMPELIGVWNHDEFFDYVDRWVAFGAWSQPDPCAPPDGGTCVGGDNAGAACTAASEPEVCTGEDAHCDTTGSWDANYGVTYGPDGQGGCILDTDPSDGTGRFPLRHGTNADDGHYGSGFANGLWDLYVNP